jgi:hypothetical protein
VWALELNKLVTWIASQKQYNNRVGIAYPLKYLFCEWVAKGSVPARSKECSLRFLNRALWYTYVIGTNKIHTFFINGLIQLNLLRHVSNDQVIILRKPCTRSLVDVDIDQIAYTDA